ncbi:AI-2E family transporter [Nonomuraea longicatena]|uniref:AI-2E family transporter n=1 Tax=Nonomuraea longicatena TaxID=83682 RepID=A0ABN1QDS0_9ACTN
MNERSAPRAVIVLLGTACAVIVLFGLREIASILGPFVLALVLVIAVAPVRRALARRGAATWLQVAAPFLIVVCVVIVMVTVLTLSVSTLAGILPKYGPQFKALFADAQQVAARFGFGAGQLDAAFRSFDPAQLIGVAQGLLAGLVGVLSGLFLIVVLLLSMCLDAPITARAFAAVRAGRPAMASALGSFAERTRRYLIVSTVFGLICSACDVVALYILGVPLPLLWGVLALITTYIPNIGFVLGLVPPSLLALLDGGVRQMLLVIVAYCAINVVFQGMLLPKFLGDAVGLSTTVTFLSLIVWTFVLGPLGALLAIPLSLLVRALLIDSDPKAAWVAALVSGGEEARPAARSSR